MMGPRLNLSTEQTSPTLDILLALISGSGSRAPTKKADKRRSLYFGARSPIMYDYSYVRKTRAKEV